MDTKTFLQAVLPKSGLYYSMRFVPLENHPRGGAAIHNTYGDIDDFADGLLSQDSRYQRDNVYFALATYNEVRYKTSQKTGREYVVGRTKDNVRNVKSLWMDWDVGKLDADGKLKPDCYASQQDAVDALKLYLKATGLPTPIIVSSGYGIHTYWVLTDEVPAAEWERVAVKQRSIMRHLGIKFDPTRDTDCASVLRPVGCSNKKQGAKNKTVRTLRDAINALPLQEYNRIFTKYLNANEIVTVEASAPSWVRNAQGGILSDFNTNNFPDSFAEIAVNHCAQLKEFSETGGSNYGDNQWYGCLALLKFFKDGDKFKYEWSAKDPRFSPESTDAKQEQWKHGPPTCDYFKEKCGASCEGCTKNCRTPLSLGLSEAVETPTVSEVVEAQADHVSKLVVAETKAELGASDPVVFWPPNTGYDKEGDFIYRRIKDSEGVVQNVRVSEPLYYPVNQIRDEEGDLVLRMHLIKRGKIEEFTMPTEKIADHRRLQAALTAKGIRVVDAKLAQDLIAQQMINLVRSTDPIHTYSQMGWKDGGKGFLIGDTLIVEDGLRKVVLGDRYPEDLRNVFECKGEPEPWIEAINTMYNREHGEPYQFAICAAFGAILAPLLNYHEWNGIPYALTSDESGRGKSTVNTLALSIYMKQNRDTIVSDSTPKAILGLASTFNNVPFLLDEITKYLSDPEDQMAVLYALSNGSPRKGLNADGNVRKALSGWCGCYPMTSNRNVIQQLTENPVNAEASQMRVFEIDMALYPKLGTTDKNHPDHKKYFEAHSELAKTITSENYGTIGVAYIQYIIKHREAIKDKLREIGRALETSTGGDPTKERFYIHLVTCVLVGGLIARKMGFIRFDMKALKNWCLNHIRKLRDIVKETHDTPQELFAHMLADLSGNIIITKRFDTLDGRKDMESHLGGTLRYPIAGRMVLGNEVERPKLFISHAAIRQWCTNRRKSYATTKRDFLKAGLIRFGYPGTNPENGSVKVYLGKGVPVQALGQAWCFEFDYSEANGVVKPVTSAEVKGIREELEVAA